MAFALGMWLAWFGVWPLAAPIHWERSGWGVLDAVAHVAGLVILWRTVTKG